MFEYGIGAGESRKTASQIIAMLDPAIPIQRAHIQAVRNLERDGCRYSNEDTDVLGAAWQTAANRVTETPPYAAKWVEVMCSQYTA